MNTLLRMCAIGVFCMGAWQAIFLLPETHTTHQITQNANKVLLQQNSENIESHHLTDRFEILKDTIEDKKLKFEAFLHNHAYFTRTPEPRPTEFVGKKWQRKKGLGKPKPDRPDLAREHEFLITLDPALGYVPDERLDVAKRRVKDYFRNKAGIPSVNWTERGPNNVGGRTNAMMFDPNDATAKKVWAGGAAGGLWYNNDITSSTSSWTKINDFWNTLGIGVICYDLNNTQTFYVGTGDTRGTTIRGQGVWKTTDGGTTWNQLANTTSYTYVVDLQVRKVGAVSELYMVSVSIQGSGVTGVFRSTDGGTTFTNVTPAGFTPSDIEIGADNRIYVGGFNGNIAYSDTGLAGSWTTQTVATGNRVEIAPAPSNANVLYAVAAGGTGSNDVGWFKKSMDKGVTWTDITIPLYLNQNCTVSTNHFTRGQAWYDLILTVSPTDENVVLAGGVDIHRSIDGGTSWTSVSYWTGGCKPYVHADQHTSAMRPGFPNECIFGSDGGVSYSTNVFNSSVVAPSFADRNKDYNVTQFYSIALKNQNNSTFMLAGAQDNGSRRFAESGSTGVNPANSATGGDGAYVFIDQDDAVYQITSYVYNSYYLSTNSGASFAQSFGSGNSGAFINPGDYDNTSNILYYAGATNQYRYVTIPTPLTENIVTVSINGGRVSAIRADAYTANRIFIGTTGGRVYRMDNANTATPTVTEIGTGINGGNVQSIDIGATDNELLVAISNFGVKSVYYSNNGGTSWTSKDEVVYGLPDMPIRWAIFNPNDYKQVMLATTLGVWSTSDITAANPGWEPSSQNLAYVRCDMLQYRSSDKMVGVATHGRGIFTTNAFALNGNPSPDFSANKTLSYLNSNITFTDNSTLATSWAWNFGANATPATANTQGTHNVQYNAVGKKTISLTLNSNNTYNKTKTDYIQILPAKNLPYTSNNGGDMETDLEFANEGLATSFGFQRGNSTVTGKNGTTSGSNAWVTGLTQTNYPDMADLKLWTPEFNFSGTGNYTLSFKTKFETESAYDGFIVEYSTNKGNTWTQLGTSTSANWYNATKANSGGFATGTAFFSGSTAGAFQTKSFNVSSLMGNASVAFRFVFKSDESDNAAGIAIDDFQIVAPDNTAPLLVSLLPVNNATNVAVNTNLVITLNEDIQKGTGNIVVKKVSDNTTFATIDINSANASITNATATITLSNNLDYTTQYYVEVANGALKDLAGNNYAGFAGNTTWKFTTQADTQAPMITTLLPANNATNVARNADLVITFNENIAKVTGNILVKKVLDNSIVETYDVTTSAVNVNNATVTIARNSAILWDFSTQYYVEIPATAFKDLANNAFAGFTGTTNWKFTTLANTTNGGGNTGGNSGNNTPPTGAIVGGNATITGLQIYPIPTRDFINFKTNNLIFTNVKIMLYDEAGKLIFEKTIDKLWDNRYKIDISAFASSLYLLKIESDQGKIVKKVERL